MRSLPVLSITILAAALATGCAGPTPASTLRAKGDHSFKLGAYDDAASNYREIAARYPGDWRAQMQLGLCELELGHYGAARSALQIALDHQPTNEAIADALAETLFLRGDHDQLFAFLRSRAEDTQNARDWLRLGRYAMKTSDPDYARIAIETAIAVDLDPSGDPNAVPSIEPYLEAANLAEELGNLDVAIRRLRQAYGLAPDNAMIADRLRNVGQIPGPSIALPPGR